MARFIKVARVTDIKPGGSKLVPLDDIGVAIFNANGAFYAIEDCCAKDGGSLSEGTLIGTMVECPNDRARFYLPTGECIDPLTLRWVTCFRLWINGDEIEIELKDAKKAARVYRFLRDYDHTRAVRGETQYLS